MIPQVYGGLLKCIQRKYDYNLPLYLFCTLSLNGLPMITVRRDAIAYRNIFRYPKDISKSFGCHISDIVSDVRKAFWICYDASPKWYWFKHNRFWIWSLVPIIDKSTQGLGIRFHVYYTSTQCLRGKKQLLFSLINCLLIVMQFYRNTTCIVQETSTF